MDNSLIDHFTAQRPAMLDLLTTLVNYESPSLDKPLLDTLADYLETRLTQLGADVTRVANDVGGDHLLAHFTLPGTPDTQPVLVLCHYDTVWPVGTVAERPLRTEHGTAFGPGTYDMKASLVLTEFALRTIRDQQMQLARPVVVLFTSDEEIGSVRSRALIEQEARKAAHVLVLEPPLLDGELKTARKGGGYFVMKIHGVAAHAGVEPEKGVSAISEMAHQILALNALNDHAKGTTINVGVVQGGTRPNVIAAYAELQIDARAWTNIEAQRVEQAILGAQPITPGITLDVQGGFKRPPLERTETMVAYFERARALAQQLGMELKEGGTGGGSDGNLTAAVGTPTLDGLGTRGAGAHALYEQIDLHSFAQRAALLTVLLTQM